MLQPLILWPWAWRNLLHFPHFLGIRWRAAEVEIRWVFPPLWAGSQWDSGHQQLPLTLGGQHEPQPYYGQ